jgi:hypothetical protein
LIYLVSLRIAVRAALAQLHSAGLRPTSVTLTVLLTALGDAGEWAEALAAVSAWPKQHGVRVSAKGIQRRAARVRQAPAARGAALFREMQAADVLPTAAPSRCCCRRWSARLAAEAEELRTLRTSLAALGVLPGSLERDEPTPLLLRLPRSVLGEAPEDDE